jgi:hypothetical protein
MKNSGIMKSLAAMSLVVALFAGKSQATNYTLPAGSFTVTTHVYGGYVVTNPNAFPVVTVQASQLANNLAGFLLDGSESASNWLKTLQDAASNNRRVLIYTDDNWNHALDGQISENGYTGGAYKIVAVAILP